MPTGVTSIQPRTGAGGGPIGPNIQAPFGQMMGRFGSGGGMGQAGYGAFAALRRRVMGAAPFPGGPGGPGQPPLPPGGGRGYPNIQAPLPNIPRQPSPWESNLNEVGFTPEQIPQLKESRDFPGAERLDQIASAQRQLRGGTWGPGRMGGGGAGYGEGYQGDALRRLLMARMGGGY